MITLHFNAIERRSDKAIMISTEMDDRYGNEYTGKVWMPLSQVRINEEKHTLDAPEWLLEAKSRDGFRFAEMSSEGFAVVLLGRTWCQGVKIEQ
jgi:hypothetical protein